MSISKKEQIVNKLINQVKDFPPLPNFTAKIMELNADPESSLEDIGRVVEAEVSLAAGIVKLANSPFFSRAAKVTSVAHAISLLGREELMNLVLSHAMFQTYKGFNEKMNHIGALRLHCFKCAIAARFLASKMGQKSSGDFFLAGLVHDVGKIIIYLAFSEHSLEKVYHDSPLTHVDVANEAAKLGTDHTILGSALLASWMFPESLQVATKCHHHPFETEAYPSYPLIIHVADVLVLLLDDQQEAKGQECMNPFAEDISTELKATGLDVSDECMPELLDEIRLQLEQEGDLAKMFA